MLNVIITFIDSMTFRGKNLFSPISFSRNSKFDFLSRAALGMSLKNRLNKKKKKSLKTKTKISLRLLKMVIIHNKTGSKTNVDIETKAFV